MWHFFLWPTGYIEICCIIFKYLGEYSRYLSIIILYYDYIVVRGIHGIISVPLYLLTLFYSSVHGCLGSYSVCIWKNKYFIIFAWNILKMPIMPNIFQVFLLISSLLVLSVIEKGVLKSPATPVNLPTSIFSSISLVSYILKFCI